MLSADMQVRRTGDWAEARRIFRGMTPRFARVARQALLREAQFLRGRMVKGITSGAPGGRAFRRHSPLTRLLRQAGGFGGSKILLASGGLRNSITVVEEGSGPLGGIVFVGVHRNAKGKGGAPLVNVAAVHEFGIAIRMTAKMRGYLFARLREAGVQAKARAGSRRTRAGVHRKQQESKRKAQRKFFANIARGAVNRAGRAVFGRRKWATLRRGSRSATAGAKAGRNFVRRTVKAFSGAGRPRSAAAPGGATQRATGGKGIGSTRGFIVIPPRPFIQPIIDVYGQPSMIRTRLYQRIAKGMGGDFGRGK